MERVTLDTLASFTIRATRNLFQNVLNERTIDLPVFLAVVNGGSAGNPFAPLLFAAKISPKKEVGPMRTVTLFAIALLLGFAGSVKAQYCNPAAVSLIVIDEKGAMLTEEDVKALAATLPKQIGDADVEASEARLAPDNKSFYWWDSTDWAKGRKIPVISFANYGTCEMRLGEATLEHHGRKMRLIFDLEITRATKNRRPVIEAPKFQNGTFRLDLTGWPHDPHTIIPRDRWKRVTKARVGLRRAVADGTSALRYQRSAVSRSS
jgi:hypothetical protein